MFWQAPFLHDLPYSPGKVPATHIEIAVSVETQIQIEDLNSHDPSHVSQDSHIRQHSHTYYPKATVFTSLVPQRIATKLRTPIMSLPRANYDPRRVCLNPFPEFSLGRHRRTIGIYLAGALFALAVWTFLDAAILSAHTKSPWGQDEPAPVHVTFVDWVPGICSLLGYITINLIDKDRVRGEDGFGDSKAVWRARLILFIGFALMAGGLAGSVTVLVLKYVLNEYPEQFKYYGYANVAQSIALMLSAVVLWFAQSTSGEYEYNLTL